MTFAKRVFDLGLAVALALVLGPIVLVLCCVLLITQGRPVFYGGERMQSVTRAFTLWKFRTMAVVAEDTGVSGGDKAARITPIGARLRRLRLDELPQLYNILKGDISFVGPRPPLRQYVKAAPDIYAKVLASRPGVTGLATIKIIQAETRALAKCETSEETDAMYTRVFVPRKAKLDLIYQRNASVCYDAKLIWQTLVAVVKK